jgi:hypothetical protein
MSEKSWPRRTLVASDSGAEFIPMIEECEDGQWRASAVVRVQEGGDTLEQPSGINMCPDEDSAREWVKRAASARAFAYYHLHKIILSERQASLKDRGDYRE